jgi:hypothetical protein
MLIGQKIWSRRYRDDGGDGNGDGNGDGSGSGDAGGFGGTDAGGFGGQGFGDSNTGGFSDGGYSADNAGGYGDAAAGSGSAADAGIASADLTGYTSDNGFNAAKDSAAASVAGNLTAADVGGFNIGTRGPSANDAFGIVSGLLGFFTGNPAGIVSAAKTGYGLATNGFTGSPAPSVSFSGGVPGSHSGTNSLGGGFGFGGTSSAGGFGGGNDAGSGPAYGGASYFGAPRLAAPSIGAAPVQLSSSYAANVGVARAGPNSLYGESPTTSKSSGLGLLIATGLAALALS